MEPEDRPTPDDANLRAFDALMRAAFPASTSDTDAKRVAGLIAGTVAELDHMLCEMRDLVAQLRASLAELRHARIKREEYKPWH